MHSPRRGKVRYGERLRRNTRRRPPWRRHTKPSRNAVPGPILRHLTNISPMCWGPVEGASELLARLGAEANDAIDEFLSLALAHERLNTPSLESFLHWLQSGDAEIKRDMERGRNEVRVMTVHGAKGLEADIVILPDTTTIPQGAGRHGALLYEGDNAIFPLADTLAPNACARPNCVPTKTLCANIGGFCTSR